MESLTGQTAVVTGGANGVGRGIASILAREGARVAIADIDLAAAEAVADELTGEGHEALAVAVDVTDAASTRTMAATVCDALGPRRPSSLPTRVSTRPCAWVKWTTPRWDRVMDINVKGALHAIQACMPSMLETRLRPDRSDIVRSRGRSPGIRVSRTTEHRRLRCSG